ncbi:MAG TPA: hypothetical protein VGX70_19905 [Gemmataceae bacterium]|nr:hypothetical protein [Gemmataceae bacterium]
MRQILWGGFLTAAFVTLFAGGASACINDRELGNSEREFKSHYNTNYQETPNIESTDSMKDHLMAYGATGLGSVLLIGSVVVTFKKPS